MPERKAAAAPARIFLVGCARSGTTVAQKVISDAVGALTVPETNFFPALYGDSAYRVFGAMTCWHPPSIVRGAIDVTWPRRAQVQASLDALAESVAMPSPVAGVRISDCARAFVAYFDEAARQQQACAWLEKSPSHLYYIDCIEQCAPDARFVHVLRDGIDTVASLQDAGKKYAGHGNNFSTDIGENIARWNQAMRWHLRCAGRPGHVLVGFDALASCNWHALLGLPQAGEHPVQSERMAMKRMAATISRDHEVWKAKAISGELAAQDSKRHLLSAAEIRRLQSELLGGGRIATLFPQVAAG